MNFFHKEFKLKKKYQGMCEGEGEGRGRWMDRRTGLNQFVPSTSSKLGA